MSLSKLATTDRQVIIECLAAVAEGPFFTDYELSVLFGVTRQELTRVSSQIPYLDDCDRNVRSAIGGAFNNLLRYPHAHSADWADWISASREAVAQIEKRWWQLQPKLEYSSLEMHGPVEIFGQFYRVISYTIRDGGHGMKSEVWQSGKWLINEEGPGCKTILAAPVADAIKLRDSNKT